MQRRIARRSKISPKTENNIRIYHAPYSQYFTEDGNQNVQAFLGNILKGQPKVWTAPFAKGDSMEKILNDWKDVLVSIKDKWPSLLEFENDLAKKVGPLSVQQPLEKRIPDIEHYWDDILLPSEPIDAEAIKAVSKEFAPLSPVHVRSQKNTLEMMKKSTNSGAPLFTKKRKVIKETYPCTVEYEPNDRFPWAVVRQYQPEGPTFTTAIIGWRGQEGGPQEEDVKQRVIWMFPFSVNLCELQLYQPLIEGAQSHSLVPAWVSNELVDARITDLFDTKSPDDLIICTDFSKYDQHFNPHMQECAETILRNITPNTKDANRWINRVFPIKYHIPLVVSGYTPTDEEKDKQRSVGGATWATDKVCLLSGQHGMASGSGGTNVDETLTHRALQYEVALRHGKELNPNSQCLGDDGILSYPGITVEDVVESYESHGQECNVDKQYASTQDCVYLRRWHHKDYRTNGICVGVYSTCRALGKLRYLERYMDPEYWTPELVALRQLSIIENCKWHPLFHEFIEFCMKRDKYRLGIDIPGFLDNLTKFAEKAIDHMPDFLGYTKTLQGDTIDGIASWEVVKYLKSAR